jgi:uncharacterized protein
MTDREREQLEAVLDALPAAPNISALDGFLVGVLLQPLSVPDAQWLPFVHDFDAGGAAPRGANLALLHSLVKRRHAELGAAIGARQWFDPWVFELEADAPGQVVSPSEMVLPWVAGFAAALERFPALLRAADIDAREPLATLFAHFDPDDLEDVGDLAELIDDIEPAGTAEQAVEDLVRCTLLLADAMQTPSKLTPAPSARQRR